MYKTSKKTQERKDAKRQFILDASAKVFASKGYHNTAVKDIVEEIGISVGSFYFYFKGKEELFTEIYLSIVKDFQDNTEKVLDTQNNSLAQNFVRVITANLWMYEKKRELARIMLVEAVGLNPEFEKKRAESIKESCRTMEEWFKRFKLNNPVNIPDERVAALVFEGSFYYLIMDWLQSDQVTPLTDSAYAVSVYNLQALKVPFENEDIQSYIKEVLNELKLMDNSNHIKEYCFE
ncbi:TetR/AcrR family transcriptional regulator [Acetobacterium woodii]|uniref:Transcriptional regulator TetR family n=1 Tax=Acetobacterium woodii (strain ATCC 29683 / DSM 1030 / JCM 2381 / KCTC 1655 / WB1) TaxID=931626 RepID=H6LHH6_ACEWD|nr:TetR/AcrR family transcriptional regulator [Acetobacterium woodii]AFA49686.1 transcriptional regulator TetR family [Acetobacterium woodii DSM 1030]